MTARHLRATLEFELDEHGSISGSLDEIDSQSIRFSGWLGLARAIVELRDRSGGNPGGTRLDLLDSDTGSRAERDAE
jgi:hypothetical protein